MLDQSNIHKAQTSWFHSTCHQSENCYDFISHRQTPIFSSPLCWSRRNLTWVWIGWNWFIDLGLQWGVPWPTWWSVRHPSASTRKVVKTLPRILRLSVLLTECCTNSCPWDSKIEARLIKSCRQASFTWKSLTDLLWDPFVCCWSLFWSN